MMDFHLPFMHGSGHLIRTVCLLTLILEYQLQNRFKEPAILGSFLFELYCEESAKGNRVTGTIQKILVKRRIPQPTGNKDSPFLRSLLPPNNDLQIIKVSWHLF